MKQVLLGVAVLSLLGGSLGALLLLEPTAAAQQQGAGGQGKGKGQKGGGGKGGGQQGGMGKGQAGGQGGNQQGAKGKGQGGTTAGQLTGTVQAVALDQIIVTPDAAPAGAQKGGKGGQKGGNAGGRYVFFLGQDTVVQGNLTPGARVTVTFQPVSVSPQATILLARQIQVQ